MGCTKTAEHTIQIFIAQARNRKNQIISVAVDINYAENREYTADIYIRDRYILEIAEHQNSIAIEGLIQEELQHVYP